MNRIRSAGSARKQVTTGAVDELLNRPISGSEGTDQHALMILAPPFQHRGHESNAEAPTPVAAELRQDRTFVVLVPGQIRICELCYRNDHERVAKSLKTTRARVMHRVG